MIELVQQMDFYAGVSVTDVFSRSLCHALSTLLPVTFDPVSKGEAICDKGRRDRSPTTRDFTSILVRSPKT